MGDWPVIPDTATVTRSELQAALGAEDLGIWDACLRWNFQGISPSARNGHIPARPL